MPVITIQAPKLSNEQKKELTITLTNEAARIMNMPVAPFTVLIYENDLTNIGFGGKWLGNMNAANTKED